MHFNNTSILIQNCIFRIYFDSKYNAVFKIDVLLNVYIFRNTLVLYRKPPTISPTPEYKPPRV